MANGALDHLKSGIDFDFPFWNSQKTRLHENAFFDTRAYATTLTET